MSDTQVFIGERQGAWKLVYIDDGIQKGFFFENAGDPKTYSPASKDSVFHALTALRSRAEQADALAGVVRVVLTELQFAKADDTHDIKWASIAYAKRELAAALAAYREQS